MAAAFSGRKPKARTHRCRPLDEQADGLLLAEDRWFPHVANVRKSERRDWKLLLPGEVERISARREDAHARRCVKQGAHGLSAGEQVLEVVHDEQQMPLPDVVDDRLERLSARLLTELERPGRRRPARSEDR